MVGGDDRGEPNAGARAVGEGLGGASDAASTRRRPADEEIARACAALFTAYLRQARDDVYALSTLPPGRFLMPGDLAGSPALTFAPLPLAAGRGNRGRIRWLR